MIQIKAFKYVKYLIRLCRISKIVCLSKIINKPIEKIKIYKQFKNDIYKKTYLDNLKEKINLNSFFQLPNIKLLKNNEEIIFKNVNKFLKHHFKLFNINWLNVNYLENLSDINNKYINSKDLTIFKDKRINKSNREEASRILSLIEQPYSIIDWSKDFISGYAWDNQKWSKKIKYGLDKSDDIKVPWELGRMQHLIMLAFAEYLNKELSFDKCRIYFKEFQNEILDFIGNNPPRYGVQWISSMDCSIRAINWLITYDLFRNIGYTLSEEVENIFIKSLFEHGDHIYKNPEWSNGLRGNHYLTNLCGLIFISLYIYNDKTQEWLNYALKALIGEINYQFNEDGSYFEASTAYHCLAVELIILTFSIIFQSINKVKLTKNQLLLREQILKVIDENLSKIMEFTDFAIDGIGLLEQIGDNDSGRAIKLNPELFN